MPSLTLPDVLRYVAPPPTKENLDYAELPIIDLAKAQTPEGRLNLYPEVCDAFRTHGFLYAINHGYTKAQAERIFDIADIPFSAVSPEDKKKYSSDFENTGSYLGYKLRQYWKLESEHGVMDQVEHYAINKDINRREHPDALQPFLPEIEAFAEHNHDNVLHPVLRLLALGLELPEETFVEMHKFEEAAESSVRFMKYYPRSEDEEEKTKNVWLKGHTDFGSITILWSQPVGGLQIMSPDGRWRWVRHIENGLVINGGDALEFFSGGYYKPTIHRVVQPPQDQRNFARLGCFYFCMPSDHLKLVPCAESPVLRRVGVERKCDDEVAPTVGRWRSERTKGYGRVDLTRGSEEGIEEEIVNGVVVKHWN